MNEKELNTLLAAGETEAIEFKENLNDSFYRNIVAFSNTRGGTLLLGIDKKGYREKTSGIIRSQPFARLS